MARVAGGTEPASVSGGPGVCYYPLRLQSQHRDLTLDVPANQLSLAVIDRYLSLKQHLCR